MGLSFKILSTINFILLVITKSPSWFYIQNYSLIYLILSNWTGIIVGIVENVLDTNFDVNKWVNSVLIAMSKHFILVIMVNF